MYSYKCKIYWIPSVNPNLVAKLPNSMTLPADNSRKRKNNPPQISDAEWIVMKVVWAHAPVTANQVVAALGGRTDWTPKTIHTLLRRLVKKGALASAKRGREPLFRPPVD